MNLNRIAPFSSKGHVRLAYCCFVRQSSSSSVTQLSSSSLTFFSSEPATNLPSAKSSTQAFLSKYESRGRPLVVMLPWGHPDMTAVKKYAEFYLFQGFDVLSCKLSNLQILQPEKIESVAKDEVLPALLASSHETKLIHGFCIGTLLYTRVLKNLRGVQGAEKFIQSVQAQVWDSTPNWTRFGVGIAQNVVPQMPWLHQPIIRMVDMYTSRNGRHKFYEETQEYFKDNCLAVPTLFLASEADPVGTAKYSQHYAKTWVERGVYCETKFWKDSKHVQHFRKYPEEYKQILTNFLTKTGFPMPSHSETGGITVRSNDPFQQTEVSRMKFSQ